MDATGRRIFTACHFGLRNYPIQQQRSRILILRRSPAGLFKNGCRGPTLKILTQRVWGRARGVCIRGSPPFRWLRRTRKLREAPVHRTRRGSRRWGRLVLRSVAPSHPRRSRSRGPLVGSPTRSGDGAAPRTGDAERRASDAAEPFRPLPLLHPGCVL